VFSREDTTGRASSRDCDDITLDARPLKTRVGGEIVWQ